LSQLTDLETLNLTGAAVRGELDFTPFESLQKLYVGKIDQPIILKGLETLVALQNIYVDQSINVGGLGRLPPDMVQGSVRPGLQYDGERLGTHWYRVQ
jgi:hypothetical protein